MQSSLTSLVFSRSIRQFAFTASHLDRRHGHSGAIVTDVWDPDHLLQWNGVVGAQEELAFSPGPSLQVFFGAFSHTLSIWKAYSEKLTNQANPGSYQEAGQPL